MNKPGALLAACFLGLTLTACTYTDSSLEGSAELPNDTGSAPVAEESTPDITENGSADMQNDPNTRIYRDCAITVLGYSVHLDCDGDPAVRVEYQFTNNSQSAAAFGTTVIPNAYQGTSDDALSYTTPAEPDLAYSATYTLVDPGESIVCAGYFKLLDTTLPVELQVKDLRDSSADALQCTLDIIDMPIGENESIDSSDEDDTSALFPSKKNTN